MNGLILEGLTTGYKDKVIIKDLNLRVGEKETLILMGSSGSGKTTLLLTILGILKANGGQIKLNSKLLSDIPIEERNIGYVPQDYGLFPHLSVIENVSYGLKIRGVSIEERTKKAKQMLELVNLRNLENRRINQLSGGQKQRVALARALSIRPDLLLLDEPLSNVDQVTKGEVAIGLKEVFKKLEIPIILVTHNHEDAIFLAERIAIMVDGKIEQIGKVEEILKRPKTGFIRKLLQPFTNVKKN